MSTVLNRKILRRPDAFLSFVRNLFSQIEQHRNPFLIGVISLFVVSVSVMTYLNYRESNSFEARDAYYSAQKVYEDEKKSVLEAHKKDEWTEDTLRVAQFNVDETFPKTVASYGSLLKEYGKSTAGYEAALELGNLYADHGQAAKAIPFYERAVSAAPGKFEKAMAYYALGFGFERDQKYAQAVDHYTQALSYENKALRGELLLALARNYERQDKIDEAIKAYDRVLSELANSNHARSAEAYKALLQSKNVQVEKK